MSFVINTTVDKNQELLDAYKELYESEAERDVNLISHGESIAVDKFALALSSEFFKSLLSENQRDTINIIINDVQISILRKVVEYIYIGAIELESKYMSDFIEACNLLQLKATISCEKKLVFNKVQKTTFTAKATSTPKARQANLETLIADLEQEENSDFQVKQDQSDDSGQIVEVYEISNFEDGDITYEEETINENEEMEDEQYELMNVVPDTKSNSFFLQKVEKETKPKIITDIKARTPARQIDEETMNNAIQEIMLNNNSFRIISEKYQIPKTLLWRRARKMGYVRGEKQKDPFRIEAIEEIKRGESLISLSKKYSIPISTLHREKLKLYEKGLLPESVNLKIRSRGEDYDDRLRIAISEILNGKSQNEVAKRYNIPKTTIWRIFKKMDPTYKSSIESSTITAESEVVYHLLQLSKKRSIKEEVMDLGLDGTSAQSEADQIVMEIKTEETSGSLPTLISPT